MNKAFIIVEIAQAHDGSLGILHSYIDALADTGIDAIKFQTHIAEAESSNSEPFRVNFSYEDKTRFDYWKRMEFSLDQWREIKQHCEDVNLEFMSSPFSVMAVEWLEEIGMKRYKIASGEVTNFLMLEKVAKTGKDIILSSGMSSFDEIDETIEFLKLYKNNLSLLQCTTSYPTQPEEIGLNVMEELKARYGLPVGLSDHSGTIFPPLAAATLGAEIIECHAVFDKKMFGPDSKASLTIDEIKQMVEGIRFIQRSMTTKVDKSNNARYSQLKEMFGKSLAVNKDLQKGAILKIDDLESKKPGKKGIPAKEYKSVIGKKINTNLKKWEFLEKDNVSE